MKKYVFIGLMLLPVLAMAQSYDSLLVRMMIDNPGLKAQEGYHHAADTRVGQTGQLPDPEIMVGGFVLPVETRLGAQIARVGVRQQFPWSGTLAAQKELATLQSQTFKYQTEQKKLALAYQLREAYLSYYEQTKKIALLEKSLTFLKSLETIVTAKVSTAKKSAVDVLQIQMRRKALEQQLRILTTQKRKPMATINSLLATPLSGDLEMVDTLILLQLPDQREIYVQQVEDRHPGIQQLTVQGLVAQQARAVNRLAGKPSFGLGMDYIAVSSRSDMEPINNGRDILQLSASIKLPIYREQYRAKDQEEQLRIAIANDLQSDLKAQLAAQIDWAMADHEAAHLQYSLADEQVQLLQQVQQVSEVAYANDEIALEQLLQFELERLTFAIQKLEAVVATHHVANALEKLGL